MIDATLSQERATLDRISTGLRARRAGHLTGGEMDSIILECADSLRSIKRQQATLRAMDGQTRQAVREGRASWTD